MQILKMKKAIFLDRDGVLNKVVLREKGKIIGSPKSLKELKLIPNIKKVTLSLKKRGFLLIMITNQPDYLRKKNSKKNILQINYYLKKKLFLDDVFVCFHDDSSKCVCRKPKPGMLFKAKKKHKINLKKSYIIGDRWRDIEAGKKAKCKTILLDHNYKEKIKIKPDFNVKKIIQVLKVIKN